MALSSLQIIGELSLQFTYLSNRYIIFAYNFLYCLLIPFYWILHRLHPPLLKMTEKPSMHGQCMIGPIQPMHW